LIRSGQGMAMISLIILLSIPLIVTLFALSTLNKLAPTIGLMDEPNDRKLHTTQTPLTGGLAIAFGMSTLILLSPNILSDFTWLLAGAGLLVITGALDDARELSVKHRFFIQFIAASIAVFPGDIVIQSLGTYPVIGEFILPLWLAYLISIFSIMAAINAMNLIDGLDGLSGSLALVPIGFICYFASLQGRDTLMLLTGGLGISLFAFLSKNMQYAKKDKASVFLGDAGSTGLGFIIGCLLIVSAQGKNAVIQPVTALWLFAVPLIDTLTVIITRKLSGSPAFKASKDHIHHRLLQQTGNVKTTLGLIACMSVTCGLVGVFITREHELISFGLFLVVISINFYWCLEFKHKKYDGKIESVSLTKKKYRAGVKWLGEAKRDKAA